MHTRMSFCLAINLTCQHPLADRVEIWALINATMQEADAPSSSEALWDVVTHLTRFHRPSYIMDHLNGFDKQSVAFAL